MKRFLLCACAFIASIGFSQENPEPLPAATAPQETPAPTPEIPSAETPTESLETTPEKRTSYGLGPDSILFFETDVLNELEQQYTLSFVQLNADQFDKIDILEQETRARLNVATVGAFFSPEPGKVRVGLRYEQSEMSGSFKLSDVSDPAGPQQLYELKMKQKETIPHLLLAFQATDGIRLSLDLFNTTIQQKSAGMVDDISYGSYTFTSIFNLPLNYELGFQFTPQVRIKDTITVEQEQETSVLLRRNLARNVVQGKIKHTAYNKLDSRYKDTYTLELGGERKVFDQVAIGGLITYKPESYRKVSYMDSTNIATLISSLYGRFRLQDNFYLTGELTRWKAAEVNKKFEGTEYIANAIVTGGAVTLSYTNL